MREGGRHQENSKERVSAFVSFPQSFVNCSNTGFNTVQVAFQLAFGQRDLLFKLSKILYAEFIL